MKTQFKLFGAAIAALSAFGPNLPASAADSGAGPFSIQASLLTPARITLGEPILIRYKLINALPQNALTHLGIYGTDWYTLTMRDAQGTVVPLIPDPRPAHPQGAHSIKSGFFRGGTSDIDYIPVTQRLAIQHPGRYMLTIHARLPYVMDDTLAEGTPEALATSSELTQTQDITFPILVTPADPVRLRNTAEALRTASVEEKDGLLARAETDALFSMPEAQAAASWRALALKPSTSTDLAAAELAELHTATGADILAEMLDTPGLVCTPISDRLNRLYNAGFPALREHIAGIARKHGFEMPEVAGTPYVPKEEQHAQDGVAF